MKLIPVPKKTRELLGALGRTGCPDICLLIMSPKGDEWKNFSDVYYALVAQTRMPWATFSKLTDYLVARGFIEKTRKTVNNRKTNFVKLTALGRDLVKIYVELSGKRFEDLQSEQESQVEARV